MSVIRLNNISKYYDDTPVLREVFFRLDTGDRVGLIGKNGAGKTTILKLILGQEKPTEGTVEVDDGLSIGYFSQFSELDDEESITEILEAVFADIHALEEELLPMAWSLEPVMPSELVWQRISQQAGFGEAQRRDPSGRARANRWPAVAASLVAALLVSLYGWWQEWTRPPDVVVETVTEVRSARVVLLP